MVRQEQKNKLWIATRPYRNGWRGVEEKLSFGWILLLRQIFFVSPKKESCQERKVKGREDKKRGALIAPSTWITLYYIRKRKRNGRCVVLMLFYLLKVLHYITHLRDGTLRFFLQHKNMTCAIYFAILNGIFLPMSSAKRYNNNNHGRIHKIRGRGSNNQPFFFGQSS